MSNTRHGAPRGASDDCGADGFDSELAELFEAAAETEVAPEPFTRDTLLRLERTRRGWLIRKIIGVMAAMTFAGLAAPYAANATIAGLGWLTPRLPVALSFCAAFTLCALLTLARRIAR